MEEGSGVKTEAALILVDVINDFFDPRGVNYHPRYDAVLEAVRRLVAAARAGGAPVVHAREAHRPGPDFEYRKLPVHCVAGSWDSQPPAALEVGPEDIIVFKRRFSAFFATDLDLLLRERGVRRLVVAGVKSHVCVRATVQDAFALGYEVWVPREATGSNHVHLHEASLEDIDRYMGRVVSLAEAVTALGGPA